MKTIVGLIIAAMLLSSGCATGDRNQNPLRGLTDRQSDWFDRTSKDWRF